MKVLHKMNQVSQASKVGEELKKPKSVTKEWIEFFQAYSPMDNHAHQVHEDREPEYGV